MVGSLQNVPKMQAMPIAATTSAIMVIVGVGHEAGDTENSLTCEFLDLHVEAIKVLLPDRIFRIALGEAKNDVSSLL